MLSLLLALGAAACGGGPPPAALSPADCAQLAEQLGEQGDGEAQPRIRVVSEEQPEMLNAERVERALADSVESLGLPTPPRPVILRYRVAVSGRAEQVAIVRSSGAPAVDTASVWAMGLAQFRPARINGCAVPVFVEQDLTATVRRPRPRAPAP